MTCQPKKVGQTVADQTALFARMLHGIAQLGEVQKVVALQLVEAQIEPATKVIISSSLASAINDLNRASHMIMHASVKNSGANSERQPAALPH